MSPLQVDLTELGTFLGSIIFICFIIYKTCKAQFEKYFENASFERKPKKADIVKHNQINAEIQENLVKARDILNADSARVHLIHNGTHYLPGVSSLKVNCAYESVKYGIKSYQMLLMEIPIPISSAFIEKMLDNRDIVQCGDIDSCMAQHEDYWNKFAAFIQVEKGIQNQALSAVLLKDKDGEPMGFVTFGYEDKEAFLEKPEELYKIGYYIEQEIQKLSDLDNPPPTKNKKFKK